MRAAFCHSSGASTWVGCSQGLRNLTYRPIGPRCYPRRMERSAQLFVTGILCPAVLSVLSNRTVAQDSQWPDSAASDKSGVQRSAIQAAAGHLSEPSHQVWCPEVFRLSGREPSWAHGFLAQFGDDSSPGKPNVEVFDHNGTLVSESRIWFAQALDIRLFDASQSARGGGIARGKAE